MNARPNILQRINWMLGAGIIFRGLSAITTLSMTYFLIPAIYAEYSFAMSLSLLTALIATAGLPDYIVSRSSNGRQYIAQLVWQSWLLNFILGGIVLTFIYLIIFRQTISTAGKWGILLINIATIFASGNVISQAAVRSLHQVSTQAKLMLLSISLSTTALIFTAWYWGDVAMIGVATLAVFILMFTIHALLLRHRQLLERTRTTYIQLYRLLQQTIPYGFVLILEMAIPVAVSYVVLTQFDPNIAGSFNLMITLLLSAMMIATVLDQTFYPILVNTHPHNIPRIMGSYLLCSLFISLPAFLIFFFHAQAVADIPIFLKYPQLEQYLSFLAYLVPLHFIAKVCTVLYRLEDKQSISILFYILSLSWIIARISLATEVTSVQIGQFMVEGLVFICISLWWHVLRLVSSLSFWKDAGKFLLPMVIASIITMQFPNNFVGLGLSLVGYAIVAFGLGLPKLLLRTVRNDDIIN